MQITTITENKIAREFFREYTTGAEVSRKLYPKSCNHYSKNNNIGSVTRFLSKMKSLGYIEEREDVVHKKSSKGRKFIQRIPYFRLSLKPFFEYSDEQIRKSRKEEEEKWLKISEQAKTKEEKKGVKEVLSSLNEKGLNMKEKKFIQYIFDIPGTRKMACRGENLFDGIVSVLEKIFFYEQVYGETLVIDIAKSFFTEDKRYLKKYNDPYRQYQEFWRVAVKFLDELTNKIKETSNFDSQEYLELPFKTKIHKYSSIPLVIPQDCSKEEKQRLLKRFEIVFYEKREPTNDEMLKTKLE